MPQSIKIIVLFTNLKISCNEKQFGKFPSSFFVWFAPKFE